MPKKICEIDNIGDYYQLNAQIKYTDNYFLHLQYSMESSQEIHETNQLLKIRQRLAKARRPF